MSNQSIESGWKPLRANFQLTDVSSLLQQAIRCARKMVMSDPSLNLRERHERFFDILREVCSCSPQNISTREYDRKRAAISYLDERRLSLPVACWFALRGFLGNPETFVGGSGIQLVAVMHVQGVNNLVIIKSSFHAQGVGSGRIPKINYVSVVHKDEGVIWARLWDGDRTDDRGITNPYMNDGYRSWNMISSNEGFEIAIQSVCGECPNEVEFSDHDFVLNLIEGWNAQGYLTTRDIGWEDSSTPVSKSISIETVTKGVVIGKASCSMDINRNVVVSGLKKRAQERMESGEATGHQASSVPIGFPDPFHPDPVQLGLFKESVETGVEESGTASLNSLRRDTLSDLVDSTIDTKFGPTREFRTLREGLTAVVLAADILSDRDIEEDELTATVSKLSNAIQGLRNDPSGPQFRMSIYHGLTSLRSEDRDALTRRLTTFIEKAERSEWKTSPTGSAEDEESKGIL